MISEVHRVVGRQPVLESRQSIEIDNQRARKSANTNADSFIYDPKFIQRKMCKKREFMHQWIYVPPAPYFIKYLLLLLLFQ